MERRVGVAVGVVLLGAALCGWLLRPGEEAPTPPAAAPAPAPPRHPVPTVPPPVPVAPPEEAPVAAADPEPPPRPLEVRALVAVAEQAGEGMVQCVLPADAPPGIPRGFTNAERHGNVLTARVEAARGQVLLQPPAPPMSSWDPAEEDFDDFMAVQKAAFATAWWTGAHPGEWGACRLEPIETVQLRGRVDEAPPKGMVRGCGASAQPEPDGTFLLEVRMQAPCAVEYGGNGMGGGVVVDPAAPPEGFVVSRRRVTMEERLAEKVEALEYLLDTPDPYRMAADVATDDGLRALILEQAAAVRDERLEQVDKLEESIEFFSTVEERQAEAEALLEASRAKIEEMERNLRAQD